MADSFKNTWWIFLLVVAGAVIFFLGWYFSKAQNAPGIVLSDILHQPVVAAASPAAAVPRADPVPPMAIVTSPVNGREAGFTIQVYSFQDRNRAQTALQTLKNGGYPAFLIISDLGDKGVWYRVRVGGVNDEAAARKMLNDIRKTYNSGFIVDK
jgi:cell division septation protein DedD